ncbi:unnamed protein product [Schistosoma margrebowiei]|uniref:Uncharacterized protein n=1 Tax=Schistosoma margrebowiei TaxID=48269 RepID=A0A183L8H2_9TREM|nr:unnamed protein product [Schistosoma margrebowiei]
MIIRQINCGKASGPDYIPHQALKHGIQWTVRNQLEDLDFEYDLALLSHVHQQMQMKTTSVTAASAYTIEKSRP